MKYFGLLRGQIYVNQKFCRIEFEPVLHNKARCGSDQGAKEQSCSSPDSEKFRSLKNIVIDKNSHIGNVSENKRSNDTTRNGHTVDVLQERILTRL